MVILLESLDKALDPKMSCFEVEVPDNLSLLRGSNVQKFDYIYQLEQGSVLHDSVMSHLLKGLDGIGWESLPLVRVCDKLVNRIKVGAYHTNEW